MDDKNALEEQPQVSAQAPIIDPSSINQPAQPQTNIIDTKEKKKPNLLWVFISIGILLIVSVAIIVTLMVFNKPNAINNNSTPVIATQTDETTNTAATDTKSYPWDTGTVSIMGTTYALPFKLSELLNSGFNLESTYAEGSASLGPNEYWTSTPPKVYLGSDETSYVSVDLANLSDNNIGVLDAWVYGIRINSSSNITQQIFVSDNIGTNSNMSEILTRYGQVNKSMFSGMYGYYKENPNPAAEFSNLSMLQIFTDDNDKILDIWYSQRQ